MPDWKDAPEWANFLAMDADGDWYWYEKRPIFYMASGAWDVEHSRFEKAGKSPEARLSLVTRP